MSLKVRTLVQEVALDGPGAPGLAGILSDNERLGKELPSVHPDPLHGALKSMARITCKNPRMCCTYTALTSYYDQHCKTLTL